MSAHWRSLSSRHCSIDRYVRWAINGDCDFSKTAFTYPVLTIRTLCGSNFDGCLTFMTCCLDILGRFGCDVSRRGCGCACLRTIFPRRISRTLSTATMLATDTNSIVTKGRRTIVAGVSNPHSDVLGDSFIRHSWPHVPIVLIQLNVISGKDCLGFLKAHVCLVGRFSRYGGGCLLR